MVTIEEALMGIIKTPKVSYSHKEMIHICKTAFNGKNIRIEQPVLRLKKGDVVMACLIMSKPRPFVIAKVVKGGYLCIPMTTKEGKYSLVRHNSRFFKNGYLTNSIVFISEGIEDKFIGVLDDSRSINKAIKLIVGGLQRQFKELF